jgi:hypothetical protein
MDLDNKYSLGEVVANDAESKTFRARESATGREVFIHLLFGGRGSAGQDSILSILLQRAIDPDPQRRGFVMEISDHKGMPYAVTGVLPGFRGLRGWLDADRAPAQPPTPPAQPPARPAQPPGPSAPMVTAGQWRVPERQTAAAPPPAPPPPPPRMDQAPVVAAAPPSPPAAPARPGYDSGEFTRLFHATVEGPGQGPPAAAPVAPASPLPQAPPPAAMMPPPAPAPPPRPAAPPVEPEPGPGEFTKLFHSPVGGSQAPPLEPVTRVPGGPSPSAGPGEFTRLFHATPETLAPPAPSTAAPLQPPTGEEPPTGFTGWFTAPPQAAQQQGFTMPPPSGPPAGGPSGDAAFTKMFGKSVAPGQPSPVLNAPPPPPPPRQPAGATGAFAAAPPTGRQAVPQSNPAAPGEYTRMFGASANPYAGVNVGQPPGAAPAPSPVMQPPPPMGAAPAPLPAKKPTSFVPVIIISAVVMLSLLGVVIYFLSK